MNDWWYYSEQQYRISHKRDWFSYDKDRTKQDIFKYLTGKELIWFLILRDILARGKYAFIKLNGVKIVVEAFCCTYTYASFYDILNCKHMVDFECKPQETSELDPLYRYKNAFPNF